MAPRRSGGGAAGVEVAVSGGPRKNFEPPPLKRMFPWMQDGSGQCDIVAGGVDETGVFKGVYMSGVHLAALLRTFALSKAFMPVDTPTPVTSLGQSLADGIPIVVVTRGCFGRELDYGPGPVRNDIQRAVWQACRDMRAEMPQVLITCIDIPIGLGSDVVQACLEPPLKEYRELMYHDGTWYTPQIVNAASLGKWLSENRRKPKGNARADVGIPFDRKTFTWRDGEELYGNMFALSWKPVLQAREPADVPIRGDLDFVHREKRPADVIKSTPSTAQATLQKALSQARVLGSSAEVLAIVDKYIVRAARSEQETLKEAAAAAEEAGGLKQVVALKLLLADTKGALKVAKDMKASAKSAQEEVAALKMILDCHYEAGDLGEALEQATMGKDAIIAKQDPDASIEAWQLLVDVLLSLGEVDDALAAAQSAVGPKEQAQIGGVGSELVKERCKARGWLLVARAAAAKFHQGTGGAAAAADAFATAAEIFGAAGMMTEQVAALRDVFSAQLSAEAPAKAAAAARRMVQLSGEEGGQKAWAAAGLTLLVAAHLASQALTGQCLDGGEDDMLALAREALTAHEEAGDAAGREEAQRLMASTLEVLEAAQGQGAALAKSVIAGYMLGGSAARKLLGRAEVCLRQEKASSSYWFAKQALRAAASASDEAAYAEALTIMQEAEALGTVSGKPFQVGGPVPVVDGGHVTFA